VRWISNEPGKIPALAGVIAGALIFGVIL
jgi:hypothetical protein